MKKTTHYVDNVKLFKEICEWQDYHTRLHIIEQNNILINEYEIRKKILKEINNPLKKKIINNELKDIQEKIDFLSNSNKSVELNNKEKRQNRVIYENIGEVVWKIVNHLASLPKYSGYPFLEDMKMLAIEHCIAKAINKFDRTVTQNPFAYLTQSVTWAFWQVLNKEKKLFKNKFAYIKAHSDEKLQKLDYNDYTEEEIEKYCKFAEGLLNEEDFVEDINE